MSDNQYYNDSDINYRIVESDSSSGNRRNNNRRNRPSTIKLILLALIFSLIGALIGGAVVGHIADDKLKASGGAGTSTENITIQPTEDVGVGAAVASKNLDTVVGISTTTTIRDIFNRSYDSQAIGSGFVVHKDGYIVTNDHVVASLTSQSGYSQGENYAENIQVVFNNGEQVPAEVLWSDSTLDLAILKIDTPFELSVAELGNSDDLVIGDQVFAIGNPLALEFHGTFTGGYVSGLDRSIDMGSTTMTDLIQTDAAINSGNSGGPLFNAQGQVVGINTVKAKSAEGLGFSISVNTLKPILDSVIETGDFEKVTLGVYTMDLESYELYLGEEIEGIDGGAVIAQIMKDSPAQQAGLETNDIIVSIDGQKVENNDQLTRQLYNYSFGDHATIEYYRDGELQSVDLEFFEFDISDKA